jgi:hypothetical protein
MHIPTGGSCHRSTHPGGLGDPCCACLCLSVPVMGVCLHLAQVVHLAPAGSLARARPGPLPGCPPLPCWQQQTVTPQQPAAAVISRRPPAGCAGTKGHSRAPAVQQSLWAQGNTAQHNALQGVASPCKLKGYMRDSFLYAVFSPKCHWHPALTVTSCMLA